MPRIRVDEDFDLKKKSILDVSAKLFARVGYANAKMAVLGALSLYMNFINLFQMILQFTGSQRD